MSFQRMNHHLVHSSTAAGRGGNGGVSRLRKSQMDDDDIMEMLWRDGRVVMQSLNQRSGGKKSSPSPFKIGIGDVVLHSAAPPAVEDVSNAHHHLFMQEDEMASWLHYPLEDYTAAPSCFERDFCTDFLYPPPSPSQTTVTVTTSAAAAANVDARSSAAAVEVKLTHTSVTEAGRPPAPPSNFVHFSRTRNARAESGPSESYIDDRRQSTTIVDSSVTPAIEHDSGVSHLSRTINGGIGNCNTISTTAYVGSMSGDAMASTSSAGRDMNTCDVTVIASPGGSAAGISASVEPTVHKLQAVSRKRKAREQAADEAECCSEDAEFEPANAKKPARGSTSAKRSRAAEVHNLSERKRRDRINEKMKALLALIPRCNKADKASMLDEAIEFIKSLQLQVQMMSMGCSIVLMMFPGSRHYMPPMGMGMGMNQPMVPYPHVFAGSPMQNPSTSSCMVPRFPMPAYHHHMHPVPPPDLLRLQITNQPVLPVFAGSPMQNPSTSSHTGSRFPMPAYHMQPVPPTDLSRLQTTNQKDPTLDSQSLSLPQLSNFCDPHQHSLGPHQMHLQTHQNQAMTQPNTTKPNTTTTTETEYLGHRKSG